jgi:hypothetical protein
MSFRLQSIRTTIKNRLDELSRLELIRWIDIAKSQKNDSTKKLYALTEEGHYVAWLIEAKYQLNQKERTTADIKIIEILETFYITLLRKCKKNLERDNFSMGNVGFVRTMLPSVVRMLQNKNIMLFTVSRDKTLGRIFLDVVKELDEETRRIVFFQIKSDVESSINATMNITREWEAARYNDIYCHNKITTLQFCERCKHATPYKVDAVDFLKSSLDVSIKGEALISKNKFDCGNCGKSILANNMNTM